MFAIYVRSLRYNLMGLFKEMHEDPDLPIFSYLFLKISVRLIFNAVFSDFTFEELRSVSYNPSAQIWPV
jgi:hypothetical protein